MASAASIVAPKLSQAALARELDVSRQAVNDLVKRGILPIDKDGLIDVELARHAIANRVRPSGKTAAALNIALRASELGYGTAVFSLEMTRRQLLNQSR